MPRAPRVLLDGPYAAPAQRWEVRIHDAAAVHISNLSLLGKSKMP